MTYKALTIAGSDSGGCAGIQADIKTFSALGVFGMSAITALTAQNTQEVTGIAEVPLIHIEQQIDAVMSDIGADAVKTGMLFSREIIRIVAAKVEQWNIQELVVDPVMVSSTGAILLQEDAVEEMINTLFPLARLITPNIPEAELIVGGKIKSQADIYEACRQLNRKGVRSVLLKGGHSYGQNSGKAVDIWYDGKAFYEFSHPWIATKNLHGTGCTYSAAIAAHLAQGQTLEQSIRKSKIYISKAIEGGTTLEIGQGSGPVNHFWKWQA